MTDENMLIDLWALKFFNNKLITNWMAFGEFLEHRKKDHFFTQSDWHCKRKDIKHIKPMRNHFYNFDYELTKKKAKRVKFINYMTSCWNGACYWRGGGGWMNGSCFSQQYPFWWFFLTWTQTRCETFLMLTSIQLTIIIIIISCGFHK